MKSICKFCNKGFDSDVAIMMHFKDIHKNINQNAEIRDVKKSNKMMLALIIGCIPCVLVVLFLLSGFLLKSTTTSITNGIGTKIGQQAPNIQIALTNGTNVSLTRFRGKPVVLWFVTTGCSSCADGAQLLASQYYNKIHQKNATILTVDLYNNLGTVGLPIQSFANYYGAGLNKTGWLYATSTQNATYEYDPDAYLDIYYVINSNGIIINEGAGLPANLDNIVSSL